MNDVQDSVDKTTLLHWNRIIITPRLVQRCEVTAQKCRYYIHTCRTMIIRQDKFCSALKCELKTEPSIKVIID